MEKDGQGVFLLNLFPTCFSCNLKLKGLDIDIGWTSQKNNIKKRENLPNVVPNFSIAPNSRQHRVPHVVCYTSKFEMLTLFYLK